MKPRTHGICISFTRLEELLGFSFLFNGLEPLKPHVTELHKRNSDIYEAYQITDQISEDLKYQR